MPMRLELRREHQTSPTKPTVKGMAEDLHTTLYAATRRNANIAVGHCGTQPFFPAVAVSSTWLEF